ncbi:MAG: hypothetical protein AAGA96_05630 [Verrucomicrobiota bacterium]
MKHTILLGAFLFLTPCFGEERQPATESFPVEAKEAAEAFGQKMMRSLSHLEEREGDRIALKSVLTALMSRGYARSGGEAPEAIDSAGLGDTYRRQQADRDKAFIRYIKRDDVGMVGAPEFSAAFHDFLSVEKDGMILDLNEDGNVSPMEFSAAGIAGNEKDVFAGLDRNEDGSLDADEIEEIELAEIENWKNRLLLTLLIGQADADEDGALTKAELSSILPDTDIGSEAVPLVQAHSWLREVSPTVITGLLSALLPASNTPIASGPQWSSPVATLHGDQVVVRYRAAVFDSTLVVEAKHTDGWRSYAMDNPARAKIAGGEEASCELPTEIALAETVSPESSWHQTKPTDHSKPEINWHTWTFEKTVYFTRKLKAWPESGFKIKINAQVCGEGTCSMARDLVLAVPGSQNDEAFSAGELVKVE